MGLAYQFMPKTVLRAGIGISYGQTGALEMWNLRMGSFVRYGPNPTWGDPVGLFSDGPNVNGDPGCAGMAELRSRAGTGGSGL